MSIFTRTALAAALMATASMASAATATDTMQVSIEITNSCTITANDLSFGTASDLSADVTGQTTVALDCTNSGPVTIAFNDGGSGDFAKRLMSNGTDTIEYSLNQGSATGPVLGDGTGTTSTLSATSTGGVTQTFDVFGRVPAGQGAKSTGTYTDSIVATVSF